MNAEAQAWQPLIVALKRRREANRPAIFWLRDDDAVEPTEALERLLDLTAAFDVPLTIAAIPAGATEKLAARLARARNVRVAVHGWSHQNHAPATEKKQELGAHRASEIVHVELSQGLTRIRKLFGHRALPVLVPPWNRIDAALLADLPALGFSALSVFGPARPAPLPTINSNVDIIDWHGTRGCHDTALLVAAMVEQLDLAWDGGDPVGLLTHHLVHDAAAWLFLSRLFEITTANGARWVELGDLLPADQPLPGSG